MFEKIGNFFGSFKNPANIVLDIVGAACIGASFIPVLPEWAKIVLRVAGIAAPVVGAAISIVKFVKERKENVAPHDFVEATLFDDDLDDEGVYQYADADLVDDYEDAVDEVAEDIRTGSKRKFKVSSNRKFRGKKYNKFTSKKSSKRNTKKDSKKQAKDLYKGKDSKVLRDKDGHVVVGGSNEDIRRGKFDPTADLRSGINDYEVFVANLGL